jgi:hypothetical protein
MIIYALSIFVCKYFYKKNMHDFTIHLIGIMAGAKRKRKTSAASKKSPPKKSTVKDQGKGKATPAKSPQRKDGKATPAKSPGKIDGNARRTVKKPRVTKEDLEQLREKIKLEETLIEGLKTTVKDKKYDGMRNGPQKMARSIRDTMKILSETQWYDLQ